MVLVGIPILQVRVQRLAQRWRVRSGRADGTSLRLLPGEHVVLVLRVVGFFVGSLLGWVGCVAAGVVPVEGTAVPPSLSRRWVATEGMLAADWKPIGAINWYCLGSRMVACYD